MPRHNPDGQVEEEEVPVEAAPTKEEMLATLEAAGVEVDRRWGETTLKEKILALIPEVSHETSTEPTKEPESQAAPETTSIPSSDVSVENAWSVYSLDKKFIRTYSIEVHGAEAKSLAEQFAQKVNGSVQAA